MRMLGSVSGVVLVGLVAAACGGEDKPPQTPPSPPVAVAPETTPDKPKETPPPAAPKASLAEMQQKALGAAMEALNAHDATKFAALYAPDAVMSAAGLRELNGRDMIAADMKEWFETFGDVKVGFARAFMKKDVVVLEWALAGTYKGGGLFGEKGKDTPIGHHGLSVLWFDDNGLVKTEHRYGDLGAVAAQLGGGAAKGAKGPAAPPIPTLPASPEVVAAKGTPDEDKNAGVGASLLAAMSDHSEAKFAELVTDDIEQEGLTTLAATKGKADAKKFFQAVTKAFPDAKLTPSGSWGVGDFAIVEYALTGTQKGPLGPLPASKKPVTVHAVDVFRIKDGKVARAWTFTNGLELLNQIQQVSITPPAK